MTARRMAANRRDGRGCGAIGPTQLVAPARRQSQQQGVGNGDDMKSG